jgi:RNA polymerase sigma-70 factor (ECF subfamily)
MTGMEPKSDIELIANGKDGNEQALAELFQRHYPSSLKLARRILRHGDTAQDAVQTAYLLAFRHLATFRGDACFKTWITRIVVNCCLLQLREASLRTAWVQLDDASHPLPAEILSSPVPTPEKSAWRQEIAHALSEAIMKLPPHLREVFSLYAVSGLSVKEVAFTLGLTIAGAKTRLFRARAGLRVRLLPVWKSAPKKDSIGRCRALSAPATV